MCSFYWFIYSGKSSSNMRDIKTPIFYRKKQTLLYSQNKEQVWVFSLLTTCAEFLFKISFGLFLPVSKDVSKQHCQRLKGKSFPISGSPFFILSGSRHVNSALGFASSLLMNPHLFLHGSDLEKVPAGPTLCKASNTSLSTKHRAEDQRKPSQLSTSLFYQRALGKPSVR